MVAGTRSFASALTARIGRPVRVHVSEDYAGLLRAFRAGAIDLGWMPPVLAASAVEDGAQLALVCERDGALTYRSAIVVRAEGSLRTLDDLASVRAAWTDRQSASGYLFPRLHLIASGVDPAAAFASEAFLGSPRAACSAVADGHADLCACFTSEAHARSSELTLADVARIYPAASWRLRVFRLTDSIPSDGMVIAPHVDGEVRAQVVAGMCQLHTFADGREALDKLLFADRLVSLAPEIERLMAKLKTLLPLMK